MRKKEKKKRKNKKTQVKDTGKIRGKKYFEKKNSLGGIEPWTFSLEDLYFDHRAIFFQASFSMETCYLFSSPGEPL